MVKNCVYLFHHLLFMTNGRMNTDTLVLSEKPYAHILSNKERGDRCDECLNRSDSLKRCSKCKFARYCSTVCQKKAWLLHKVECICIKNVAPKLPTDSVRLLLQLVQRYLAGDHLKRFKNERCFWDFMSHSTEIKDDKVRTEQFAQILQTLKTLTRDVLVLPPADILFKIFGKMTINTFSICNQEMQAIAVGVYILASTLDHSCTPSAVAVFEGTEIQIRVQDNLPNPVSLSDLRISYIDALAPWSDRQRQLKEQYYFTCDCSMCQEEALDDLMTSTCCQTTGCGQAILESKGVFKACSGCGKCVVDRQSYSKKKDQLQTYSQQVLDDISAAKKEQDARKILKLCEDCIRKQKGILHTHNIYHVRVLDAAFDACIDLQKWDEALQYGLATIDPYRKYYRLNHPNVGIQLMKIAKIQLYIQKYKEALRHFEMAEMIISTTHGKKSALYTDLSNLLLQTKREMLP